MKHGCCQSQNFKVRLGIHIREAGASEQNLRLCGTATVHPGVDPEIGEVIASLFVDPPSVEAQSIQPLGKV